MHTHYAKTESDYILAASTSKRPLLNLFYYKSPDLRSGTVPSAVYFFHNQRAL